MRGAGRTIAVIVGILLVDGIAYFVRDVNVSGIPASYLLVPGVAIAGIIVLGLMWFFSQHKISMPSLPYRAKPRGSSDDAQMMLFVMLTLLHAATEQEIRQTELQESIDGFVRYFNEVDQKNQATQLRLTLISICIGLVGGYLPLIVTVLFQGK